MGLAAVGGYGRRELCPGSDLDLVLVHAGRPGVAEIAERIWYPLWDAGVRVDHSVRTVKEAIRLSDAELEVAMGLLDARCVWGDAALVEELRARVRERWAGAARRRLGELAAAVDARHSRGGEVAFLLEPDLKEDRGGLRDVTVLAAAAAGSPVVPDLAAVRRAAATLLDVRTALHRATGRPGNQLVLEQQDAVAPLAGYAGADELMAAVAAAGRTIARASDDAWRRVRSWIAGPRGYEGSADRSLGPGLALRDGEVVVTGDPGADPSLGWRAAAASASAGARLSRAALERLAADQPVLTERWSTPTRQALLSLLGAGPPAVGVFEELDESGVLVRLLPEWEPVRSRPQRNALHRYTVDRHLVETAAAAAQAARSVSRPDLLLVGAWLHDLGKGLPGDHTANGMALMATVAARMGFEPDDVATLVTMVEHHLLLPDVATRRDLDDPAVVHAVADAVGDANRLELLHALAAADGAATGPAAWGRWKAGLVDELVHRVERVLSGAPAAPQPPPLERARAAVPPSCRAQVEEAVGAGRPGAWSDGSAVAVVAPDRAGVLALVAGVLALNRLVVLAATCATTPEGMALDVFAVEHETGASIDVDHITADLLAALDGRLPVGSRVADRARAYVRRAGIAAAPRVVVSDDGAASRVEVRAADDVGLLHRIAGALAEAGLDVRGAKVSTLGHEVVDTFTVTAGGGPIGAARRAEVEAAIAGKVGGAV